MKNHWLNKSKYRKCAIKICNHFNYNYTEDDLKNMIKLGEVAENRYDHLAGLNLMYLYVEVRLSVCQKKKSDSWTWMI